MISMTPSNRPMKSPPRLLFLLRGGPTSTNGSPRLVTSNGLPVFATSAMAPRHLALTSPAPICLMPLPGVTLTADFLLMDVLDGIWSPPDDHGHFNMVMSFLHPSPLSDPRSCTSLPAPSESPRCTRCVPAPECAPPARDRRRCRAPAPLSAPGWRRGRGPRPRSAPCSPRPSHRSRRPASGPPVRGTPAAAPLDY